MKKYIVTVNGTSYEVFVQEADATVSAPVVTPVAAPVTAPVTTPVVTEEPVAVTASSSKEGSVKITAPMAGSIVKVLIAPGDTVKEGQTIFVLEALKLENNVPAPCDGVVASVSVTPGTSVDSDQVIATLN